MKILRRGSLLLSLMLTTFSQFILAHSQIPSLQGEQQQQQHSMEDQSKLQQTEKELLQQQHQQDHQRTLRGVTSNENEKEQTAPTDHEESEHNERQERRRRRELRERHVKERARIQRILQEQDTIDVIVTLDESVMGREAAAAASDFVRTNAKIMTITMSQFQDLQQDPTVLLVEVDALVYPQQQQQEQQLNIDESVLFSLQSFAGQEQTPWNVAAVLQYDFTTIPSTPQQPMVSNAANNAAMSASCSVKVCVIDSGCLVDHPDLPFQKDDGRIQGREFDVGTAMWDRPIFYAYHGSHVVGTMMAQGQNNQGSRGIIPQALNNGVCLLVARVFGDVPMASAKTSTIEMAAEWCADQGAQVINLSLAAREPSSNSAEIYRRMEEDENLLIVAASGNGGSDAYAYPASYDNVISVGSVNAQMQKSDFSQYNNQVSLVAPGENILSTVPSHTVMNAAGDVLFESSTPMVFSPLPNQLVTGSIYNCGRGETLCEGARGKVCLVQRGGTTTYETKAENCEDGGSIAVLISYEAGTTGPPHDAFLGMNSRISIPVLTVSYDDGQRLLQETQPVTINYISPAYRSVHGTSMAAPHVAAVAAKIWAARRQCTNAQIRQALQETALDLGPVGYDNSYGHGFIQATAAYFYLLNQPEPCGIPGGAPPHVPIQPVGGVGPIFSGGTSGGTPKNGGDNNGGGNTNAVMKRKTPGASANKNDLRIGNNDGRNQRGQRVRGSGGVTRYLGEELLNAVRGGRQSVVTAIATASITVP